MVDPAVSTLDETLAAARVAFTSALARDDARAAAEVYADDARLLLPDAGPLDGRSAIEGFWRAGLDAGMDAFEVDPVQLIRDATFACEVGRYTLRSESPHEHPLVDSGTYLIVHRPAAGGEWRRAVEFLSPDTGLSGRSRTAARDLQAVRHVVRDPWSDIPDPR